MKIFKWLQRNVTNINVGTHRGEDFNPDRVHCYLDGKEVDCFIDRLELDAAEYKKFEKLGHTMVNVVDICCDFINEFSVLKFQNSLPFSIEMDLITLLKSIEKKLLSLILICELNGAILFFFHIKFPFKLLIAYIFAKLSTTINLLPLFAK